MKRNRKIKVYTTPIIAGEFKGRRIEIPATDTTRSSKAVLRESFFNTVQFDIVGKNFVEVFAGSGSVGLEALSRGAGQCFFMEKDTQAYRSLQNNIAKLDPSRCHTFLGDSFQLFERVYETLKRNGEKSFFYFDPPFAIREGMEDIYDKTIALIETIEPDVCDTVAIEHMTGLALPERIGALEKTKSRKFGKSTLTYYRPVETER
jgi:16S rRNA (guanine(966)-N(2))-methyltransferase RsmD